MVCLKSHSLMCDKTRTSLFSGLKWVHFPKHHTNFLSFFSIFLKLNDYCKQNLKLTFKPLCCMVLSIFQNDDTPNFELNEWSNVFSMEKYKLSYSRYLVIKGYKVRMNNILTQTILLSKAGDFLSCQKLTKDQHSYTKHLLSNFWNKNEQSEKT